MSNLIGNPEDRFSRAPAYLASGLTIVIIVCSEISVFKILDSVMVC